jgi:hypothetical protein
MLAASPILRSELSLYVHKYVPYISKYKDFSGLGFGINIRIRVEGQVRLGFLRNKCCNLRKCILNSPLSGQTFTFVNEDHEYP